MKVFTQQSINLEEIANKMQSNLVKNAAVEQQATSMQRFAALKRLSEAAEIFDQIGNEKKAAELTNLIAKFVQDENQRDSELKLKVSSLKKKIHKLAKCHQVINQGKIEFHYLNSTASKISQALSEATNTQGATTYSELNPVLDILESKNASPRNIELINNLLKIADDTLEAVELEDEEDEPEEEYWEG